MILHVVYYSAGDYEDKVKVDVKAYRSAEVANTQAKRLQERFDAYWNENHGESIDQWMAGFDPYPWPHDEDCEYGVFELELDDAD